MGFNCGSKYKESFTRRKTARIDSYISSTRIVERSECLVARCLKSLPVLQSYSRYVRRQERPAPASLDQADKWAITQPFLVWGKVR